MKIEKINSITILCTSVLCANILQGCGQSSTTDNSAQDNISAVQVANANNLDSDTIQQLEKPVRTDFREHANFSEDMQCKVIDTNSIEERIKRAIPTRELTYHTDDLTDFAKQVNQATWQGQNTMDKATIIKIQALLNWHHHGVGAVNGRFNKNTIKAMQAFQQARNIPTTQTMNDETWRALTANDELAKRPVLINYKLTHDDVRLPYHPKGMQFRSVREAVAEKFHISQSLLKELNHKTPLHAGRTIIIYNPSEPNTQAIDKVVVNKKSNILYAYDDRDKLVASYPTTVGSRYTPSPHGSYRIMNRILDPTYNRDFTNKNSVLPPGPNNPVGRVWLGLNKQGFGIHGSPEPELISQQNSHGCVRLTNWDALALYSTINDNAKVILQ